ncbi:MAG: CapA family protein [Bacteroides sp.]|nr:CapA family protein [Bacteroides sp.]
MRSILLLLTLLYNALLPAQQRITLLFAGDLMQHQAQIDAARTADGRYDYSGCFASVKEQIEAADIAIGNLEVTLGGKPYRGYPAFSAPDEYLMAIRDAGFDVLLTANNHCLDRGRKGLERTLSQLDSLGIPCAGTYRHTAERTLRYPLLIEKKGFRIALLNYTYGTNGIRPSAPNHVNYINKEEMQADIRAAHALRPDAIIACMHWGEEYKSLPNREQKELVDWLLARGVTHIIGAHPHVIQPMELREAGTRQHVVAYSLGNFFSNMSALHTDGGLLFTLELEKYPLPQPIAPQFLQELRPPTLESAFVLPTGCRVSHCHYSLVWTLRPKQSGEKNFRLLPVSYPADSLPTTARNSLKIFTKNARTLLGRHNIGIGETNKK